jgi:hypothetical protein
LPRCFLERPHLGNTDPLIGVQLAASFAFKIVLSAMKTLLFTLISGLVSLGFLACADIVELGPTSALQPTRNNVKAFKSEQELKRYFRQLAEKQRRRRREYLTDSAAPAVPMPSAIAGLASGQPVSSAEAITNTQHAGVDEGDIVKLHGDHLVILRRGRIFTVAVNDQQLQPISKVDAFGPEMNPSNTWYDEMLVSDDTIVVIGYSYERGGTEVGLFNIDAKGQLSYRSTYHLRSNDYYSSRNYASRLIGNKLIFYSPLYLDLYTNNLSQTLPAVRKWHKGAKPDEFRRIVPATRIYRPSWDFDSSSDAALHTVTVCNLANGGFDCEATSVIGPVGEVFYVSPDAVYVWAASWSETEERKQSMLFRMPLDGSGPAALRVSGSPVDQFSFLQSEDQYLNVLVRSNAKGDGMWAAEVAQGDVALLRIPVASFSDGSETVSKSNYHPLPKAEARARGYTFQNRFVGDYVIYGTGSGWGAQEQTSKPKELFLVNWSTGNTHRLELPHGIDRIEQMGSDAVVVGTDGKDLHFTAIRLGQQPEIASRYTREAASQGELRSHGFFYKPEDENNGTLGLPISTPGRPGYKHLFESSAAILFLRNEGLQFRPAGELDAESDKAVDDNCRASCVDWYGNARPLFFHGRVFALLGYELVEGRVDDGRITEIRRVNYGMMPA